jgi:hypothetical protein
MGKRPGGSSSAHSENAVEPCAYSRPGATPKPLPSPLAANRVPPAICGICTAPAVRGAYENVGGEQFYSTFESAHFGLPPTFRSRDFGQGREAIIGAQPCRLAGTWNDRPAQLIGAAARFVDAAAPIYWAV